VVSYFLSTDDYSVGAKKIEEIKKGIKGSFDEVYYDLDEDSVYDIINELTTVSLFDEPKVIIVKSAEELKNVSENGLKELLSSMADYNSTNVLIGITTVGYDFNDSIFSQLKKYASFIDIKVKNISLDEYAKQKFEEEGYEIPADVLSLLVSYCDNLTLVDSSIEILKCYKTETKKITKEDVLKMIPKPLEDKGYELTNAVLRGDKKRIFEIYNDFKTINAASNLIPMLLSKFQQLYNVYNLARANVSQEEIANLFQVKPNVAYYMIKDAKTKSIYDIKNNIDLLTKLDMDIKSGKIEYEIGIQLYFLR